MLTSLRVRDLAVLEDVEVAFGEGLTVLTGETGAGKSLVVDAVMLLAGGRADPALVRAGAVGSIYRLVALLPPAGRRYAHPHYWAAFMYSGVEADRSEEHTSELQSLRHLVCRLLLAK